MEYIKLINDLISELSYRVGVPDLKNKEHQSVMFEILTEWGEIDAKYIIMDFLNEAPKSVDLKNKTTGDDSKYTHIGRGIYVAKGDENKENAQKFEKDASGALKPISNDEYEKRKAQQGDAGEDAAATKNAQTAARMNTAGEKNAQLQQPETGTSLATPEYQANVTREKEIRDRMDAEKVGDGDKKVESNEDIKTELDNTQTELQQKRDMGISGAGGAVASQGESRYCNTMNTLNVNDLKEKNKSLVDEEINNLKSRSGRSKFPTASELTTLQALGLDPKSDEAYDYIAIREVFAKQELERIKAIPNSVFYLGGKAGFAGNDGAYLEWMRASFDGTLATRKILDEDTDMDMSKPNTTLQSEKAIDDNVESKLVEKLKKAELDGNQDDINFYTKQVKGFKKFRKYHDTYTVGQDSNGRMCVVSISNKKGDDLKDPQNNTTPANRFNVIKDQYGDDVAKAVIKSIDEGIEAVSDVKKSAVRTTNQIEIDDSISQICELHVMKKYINNLNSNKAFIKYVEGKGKDVNTLSITEKLKLMQEHSQLLLDSGKNPAFDPYGKIMTKIGEFSQVKKFRDSHPNIDFDSPSIGRCIQIKETEKDAVTSSHNKVVSDIKSEDEKLGFPKNGKNGPHVQGYISTVMDAMHFDTYIDGGDGQIILQMGIRGAQPKHIRECLAEKSGFKGNMSTTEGRDELKRHLKETCRIDSKSGSIVITNGDETTEICDDTWRTAGTSQKVASGFGFDMRNCISAKVDSRRRSK